MSTSHLEILFLNNKEVNSLAGNSMPDVIHDIERVLSMLDKGEAINAGKIVLHWGKPSKKKTFTGASMPCQVLSAANTTWLALNGLAAIPTTTNKDCHVQP